MSYVNTLIAEHQLPKIASNGWAALLTQATRYCEDQYTLPFDALWLLRRLTDAAHYKNDQGLLDNNAFTQARENRLWRHQYLSERGQDDILQEQILIKTEGEVIGQINGLSVLQFMVILSLSVNLHELPASLISVMVNLLMSNEKPNLAVIFMLKVCLLCRLTLTMN